MPKKTTPKKFKLGFKYPFEEFASDLEALQKPLARVKVPKKATSVSEAFEGMFFETFSYFCETKSPRSAEKKANLFLQLYVHIAIGGADYHDKALASCGRTKTHVKVRPSEALLRATHEYFCTHDIEEESDEVLVANIKALAVRNLRRKF